MDRSAARFGAPYFIGRDGSCCERCQRGVSRPCDARRFRYLFGCVPSQATRCRFDHFTHEQRLSRSTDAGQFRLCHHVPDRRILVLDWRRFRGKRRYPRRMGTRILGRCVPLHLAQRPFARNGVPLSQPCPAFYRAAPWNCDRLGYRDF